MKCQTLKYVVLCYLLHPCVAVSGDKQETFRLFSNTSYPLSLFMMVLEDKTNSLTIDQVSADKHKRNFRINTQPYLNLGITESTYWVKLVLQYPNAYPNSSLYERWYFELGQANLDIAELFILDHDGIYDVKSSDMRMTYDNREIIHVNSIFPISFSLGQTVTLYAKIKNKTSIVLPVRIWSPSDFPTAVSKTEFYYGFFFGCMIILLIYNLFLYVSVRDVSYLYYVLYLGGITIFDWLEVGHGLIHVHDLFFTVKREYILLVIWETAIAGILFAKSFMSIGVNHPKLNRFLNILMASSIVSFLVTPLCSYATGAVFQLMFMTVFLPAYLSVIVYCWIKGNSNAGFFFFAWISNIIGLLVFTGVTYQIIPATPMTLASQSFGILIEAVLLSFALASRIKKEQVSALLADKLAMANLSRYHSAYNNAKEGIYTMSPKGKFYNANPAMIKMLGFCDFKELSCHGSRLSRALFGDDPGVYALFISRGSSTNELYFRGGIGSIYASHHAKLVVGEGGASRIEGVLTNVTESVLKNIAIREEEESRLDKDIAKASVNAKNEFLANMSHEIRTPLSAIIGFSESLKDDTLSKKEKDKSISLVVSSSHKLLQLLNDILDFSKVEANKLKIERVPVDVVKTVDSVREEFVALAVNKDIGFDVVYRFPFPSHIISDPLRISQVLKNICSNALKFTGKGSVLLSVYWDNDVESLKIEVIDSGVGMKDEVRKDLFQVFNQADTSSTRKYGGVGLGLAISKKLANLMGGDISVLSKPGKGSVFTFELGGDLTDGVKWIYKFDSKATLSRDERKVTQEVSGKVLVAEDNSVNQKLFRKILIKMGADVVIASDGVEACEVCEKSHPDFVLMDINMPKMGGIEAIEHLRHQGYQMPIYVLTAEHGEEEQHRALVAGAQGVLTKPLDLTKLRAALVSCVPYNE